MAVLFRACVLVVLCLVWLQIIYPYNIRNHPCCLEPNENLTLAMIIDAFEIYGHDPTDKLDNLWLYQNEMMRIKTAEDQYLINERVHIATDHLGRFIKLHIQELKVLLITLDDVIDNMMTMYENHNSIAAERKATYTGGPVPMEFYISQEFYCGKNVYIFLSELYSDIYNMGKGTPPYCKDRSFVFMGFLHYHDEQKYYLIDDPSISFPTDNYIHGLECHIGICIFRFPFKKLLQRERDVSTLPKAIVKCGLIMYKLPPLSAALCIITSGSFILDFNIQGIRRHRMETRPFLIPGDPGTGIDPVPPYIEPTVKPTEGEEEDNITVPYILEGCLFMYPPNYGVPHHPYSSIDDKGAYDSSDPYYPHQNYKLEEDDTDT
ncbi:unnamed protein product [Leptidea sinapis]|uniref:Uncharacterized protein n=1 Tax=Leptidea sinapis TaxID=189913 RepID=A0A5E4QMU1_9NEOP|nr:unnamed protein product [Leptidea sinapis]